MGFKVVRTVGWMRIFLRPLTLLLLFALLVFAGWALLAAEAASAARYAVAQCGWHVGQDAGWRETGNDKFVRDTWCRAPDGVDPFEDVHLKSSTRNSTAFVAGTRFARWRWNAPAGTGIVTVRGQRWQVLGDHFEHRLGGVDGSGFTPFLQLDTTDRTRRDFARAFSPHAAAFESRLLCARSPDRVCNPGNQRSAAVRALTFTLEDSYVPVVAVTGPAGTGGWMRGMKPLNFTGSDLGAGVLRSFTMIDGTTGPQTGHPCQISKIAGEWRGTTMQPCPTSVSGIHRIDTARLSDGPHQLRQCSIDFAGNIGCSPDWILHSDNNPPATPRDLAVEGGEGWHRRNGFNLTWTVPDQGAASPVVASVMRISGQSFDSGPIGNLRTGAMKGALVPRAGEYRLKLWLVDAAGNQSPSNSATAILRLDDVAPSAYLMEPDRDRPEAIRAAFSDRHSGVVAGRISVRRLGRRDWIDLPTELSGSSSGQLKARFPADDLEPGSYAVRALVVDGAGNPTVALSRGNGSPMILKAPIKSPVKLRASLKRKSHRGLALRVPYRGEAALKVRLTGEDGRGIAGQSVSITQSPVAGSTVDPSVAPATTGDDGRLSFPLPVGPTREVRVKYDGNERYLTASAGPLKLKVKGFISLAVSPRRLSNGARVRIRGRVGSRGVRQHGRGSPVAIQYLQRAPRRWRPVLVTHAGAAGRYRARYRFRYITSPARIRLRAKLLPPPGYPYKGAVSRSVAIRVGA